MRATTAAIGRLVRCGSGSTWHCWQRAERLAFGEIYSGILLRSSGADRASEDGEQTVALVHCWDLHAPSLSASLARFPCPAMRTTMRSISPATSPLKHRRWEVVALNQYRTTRRAPRIGAREVAQLDVGGRMRSRSTVGLSPAPFRLLDELAVCAAPAQRQARRRRTRRCGHPDYTGEEAYEHYQFDTSLSARAIGKPLGIALARSG